MKLHGNLILDIALSADYSIETLDEGLSGVPEVTKESREKVRLPPYLTYATWHRLLESLRRHTPSHLDRSHLMYLGFSQSTALTVKSALTFLGLIDPHTLEPTVRLRGLLEAKGEDYKTRLKEMIEAAYQPVLSDLDLQQTTLGKIEERFRRYGAEKNVGSKCLSFFLAVAKDAGITLSPNLVTRSRLGAAQSIAHPVLATPRNRRGPSPSKHHSANVGRAGSHHFASKLPDFDPGWPKEVRDEWFARFQTLVILIDKFPQFNAEWPDELKLKWFDHMKGFMESSPTNSGTG